MKTQGADLWSVASARIRDSDAYRELLSHRGVVRGLPTAAAGWVLDLLSQDLERPLVLVTPRESEAMLFAEAVKLMGGGESVYFPSPALSPYQETEASLLVRAQESVALDFIARSERPLVSCTPRALARRLPDVDAFGASTLRLVPEEELPIEELVAHLVDFGYRRSDLVVEVGVFAVRGGVVDLFPPSEDEPVRLDFFGDTIESLRSFDTVTQRSSDSLDEIRIQPLSLFPSGESVYDDLADALEQASDSQSFDTGKKIGALRDGNPFEGWQNYLPLIQRRTNSLLELMDDPLLVVSDRPELLREARHQEATLAVEFEGRFERDELAVPPERLTIPGEEVVSCLESFTLELQGSLDSEGPAIDFWGSATDSLIGQMPRFPREVETARARKERLAIVAPANRHERLRETLTGRELEEDTTLVLADGELSQGFRLPAAGLVVFGENQLFAEPTSTRKRRKLGPFLSGIRDLKVGEFVVHEDHGIGQFVGMRSLGNEADASHIPSSVAEMAQSDTAAVEVMEILYSSGKTLLLPLSRLDQIQRYSGIEGFAPKLDKLGGSSWNKKKGRVKKGLKRLATDLLKLYAEREVAKAPPATPDSDMLRQFETAFEYEETPDQLDAIAQIKEDLERQRPMDRLLCGDVGFGKTEVSMRAAFKMVDSGYQVAVLAPTTILADQHLQTFTQRFAGFPVRIEMVSRSRTNAEVRAIAEKLAAGEIDILIGTHRLLSKDLAFKDLGLLVIDEEQRFGVAQKERFKELRREVHVLAMSATPVPRTLQLSLAGVRDLSTIESPPRDRMAVETRIVSQSADLIREAIEYELERGGQVYYVFNRVEGIEAVATELRRIVPELRITIGHGQMDEQELTERMHAFKKGSYDLLLATTIIENGIDIPNVNTMLIHRADRFGLAQLYQLRGRVGRSDQLAYCYLMVPGDKILSEDARRRLTAIREFTELGAGFRIAARDLEIRGAGNLLGAEQSGHIAELGIETYLKMLEDTVRELRGEAPAEAPSATIDLPIAMAIPEEYIGESSLRMEFYRRLATLEESSADLLAELRDRFGPPPEVVQRLVDAAVLKSRAEHLRVQSITSRGSKLVFRLRRDSRVDIERLIEFVQTRESSSFSPSGVLTLEGVPPSESLSVAHQCLEHLGALPLAEEGAVH
ncbi:MAG: transcription-repair coupling factor [Acidobacteriota bacterium]